jgi:hypothetical protein
VNRLAPLMSSAKDDWQTPPGLLDLVRQVAPIALDPCTTAANPCGAEEIAIARVRMEMPERVHVDGLTLDWATIAERHLGLVYVNPPYGRAIGDWTDKCRNVADDSGISVIALLPARTDTQWWQTDCAPPRADAVCFWRGRLTFVGAPAPAPFPSALVYWGPSKFRFADVFAARGAIWM